MNTTFEAENTNSVQIEEIDNSKNSFNVYPNPASNDVTIEFEKIEQQSIYIFNIIGNMIYSETINDKNIKINVSNWSKGIYLVKTKDKVEKLIIN